METEKFEEMIIDFINEPPKAPVLMHFGDSDASIPIETVDAIKKAHPSIPVHIYHAGHGFNCDARSDYNQLSAMSAETRTLAFFAEHLKPQRRPSGDRLP